MGELFNKHMRPDFSAMSESEAWAACEAYEDYAYRTAESLSEDEWERRVTDVRALYDEYYGRFGS